LDWIPRLLLNTNFDVCCQDERERTQFFVAKLNILIVILLSALEIDDPTLPVQGLIQDCIAKFREMTGNDDVVRLVLLGCCNSLKFNARTFIDCPANVFWHRLFDFFDSLYSFMFFSQTDTSVLVHVDESGMMSDIVLSNQVCVFVADILTSNQFTLLDMESDTHLAAVYEEIQERLRYYSSCFLKATEYYRLPTSDMSDQDAVYDELSCDMAKFLATGLGTVSPRSPSGERRTSFSQPPTLEFPIKTANATKGKKKKLEIDISESLRGNVDVSLGLQNIYISASTPSIIHILTAKKVRNVLRGIIRD